MKGFLKIGLPILWVLLCMIPILYNVNALPLQIWDESRSAINALEMLANGNYFVPHFNGEPDLWNLRPPLVVWFKALSFKFFGHTVLAQRIPVFIAVALTCFLFIRFMANTLKEQLMGLIAALVLVLSPGYNTIHVARTGDYDAILILFTSWFVLTFFRYLYAPTDKKQNYYLRLALVALLLAFFTKTISAFFFIPGIILYTLIDKGIAFVFNKRLLIHVGAFILVIVAYYGIFELINPGYIKAELANNFGRFSETQNEATPSFWYFFKLNSLKPFYILPLFGLVLIKRSKSPDKYRFIVFANTLIITYLVLISFSSTKHAWYNAQIFPLAALSFGIILFSVFNEIAKRLSKNPTFIAILRVVFMVLVFSIPYHFALAKAENSNRFCNRDFHFDYLRQLKQGNFSIKPYQNEPEYCFDERMVYESFLKEISETHKTFAILTDDPTDYRKDTYNPQIVFHSLVLKDKGTAVNYVTPNSIEVGQKVVSCNKALDEKLLQLFTVELIEKDDNCNLYKIIAKK